MKTILLALMLILPFASAQDKSAAVVSRYGDLFAASGKPPGNRTFTYKGKNYQMVQILGMDQTGSVRLKTKQGELVVSTSSLPQDWANAITALEAATPKAVVEEQRKVLSINEILKARAKEEWPDDYRMQLYHFENQKEAWEAMRRYESQPSMAELVASAKKKWPDDYSMQVYHVKNQMDAREKLNRK